VIPITSTTRIFLATQPTDMRRSFDGLCALTIDIIQESPTSGHLFLFRSRRGEAVKLLWWDRSGFVIWYKRLQKNTFRFPKATEGRLEIEARDLMMILEGLEYKDVTKRRDYRLSCEPGVL